MSSILFPVLKLKHECSDRPEMLALTFCWTGTNKITGTQQHQKAHVTIIIPRPKGIGSRHKSGMRNNRGRQQTTPRDNWCFNRNNFHSKMNELSLLVIPVPPPLNDSVNSLPELSSVFQQSSISSHNTTQYSQAYSIPSGTSDDLSNTMPLPSKKNGSRNNMDAW